jgi:hypothetical protein
MSSIDRDQNRKVSKPTEADFIRGFAQTNGGKANGAALLTGLVISFIARKPAGRRGRE